MGICKSKSASAFKNSVPGVYNPVPAEFQGVYREAKETENIENKSISYEYKLQLKEKNFELTQTKIITETKSDDKETMIIDVMTLLMGDVDMKGNLEKGEEITIKFETKNASFQQGGKNMGVPLPDNSHKVDFVMKYSNVTNEKGTFNSLSFVNYPKIKFEELTGVLIGKKCKN